MASPTSLPHSRAATKPIFAVSTTLMPIPFEQTDYANLTALPPSDIFNNMSDIVDTQAATLTPECMV
jgi:hypothetical protein